MPDPTLRTDYAAGTPLPPRTAEVLEIARARTARIAAARERPVLAITSADDPEVQRLFQQVQAETARRLKIGEGVVTVNVSTFDPEGHALPAGIAPITRATVQGAAGATFDLKALDGATQRAAVEASQSTGYGFSVHGGRLWLGDGATGTVRLYTAYGSLLDDDDDLATIPGFDVQAVLVDGLLAAWYEGCDAADLAELHRERYYAALAEGLPKTSPKTTVRPYRPL